VDQSSFSEREKGRLTGLKISSKGGLVGGRLGEKAVITANPAERRMEAML
jgi:hypothetical protein